jgi:hypothetical protein
MMVVLTAIGCASVPNRDHGVAPAPFRRPSVAHHFTAPTAPPLRTGGTNYEAITRSLLAYDRWVLAHDPNPARISRYLAPGSIAERSRGRSSRLNLVGRRFTEIYRGPITIHTIDDHFGDVVSLGVTENVIQQAVVDRRGKIIAKEDYTEPTSYVVLITRGAGRRWYLASIDVAPRTPNVQLTAAAVQPGGDLNGQHLDVGISYDAPGSAPHPDDEHPERRAVISVRYVADPNFLPIDVNGLCTTPTNAPGYRYLRLIGDISGRLLDRTQVCLAVGPKPVAEFGDTGAEPPTFEEVWRQTNLPPPSLAIDPPGHGITLATNITTASATRTSIHAALRSYTISGTATLDHVHTVVDGVDVSDGTSSTSVFQNRGTHTIAVRAVWHAAASLSAPDTPALLTFALGSATITVTRTYFVSEIRAVLQLFSADPLRPVKETA